MIVAIAIQEVCCVNKTLALNGFSDYFSRFYVRTIDLRPRASFHRTSRTLVSSPADEALDRY